MLITNCSPYLVPTCAFRGAPSRKKASILSLVLIGAVRMQAVSASPRVGIVERNLQVVISQKPIEGSPRFFPPASLSRCKIGLQTCGNYCAGFDRLLIEASLFCFLRVEAVRSDGYEVTPDF